MARRRRNNIHVRPVIGIYCEGQSEEQYFKMLCQKYNASNIHAQRIKVNSLGESGEKLIEAASRKAKASKQSQAYVVFDRDDKTKEELQKCQNFAKRRHVNILLSSECFEVWILMHFEPVMTSYNRMQLFKKLSSSSYFGQNYIDFKGSSYQKLYDYIGKAMKNAEVLYKSNNDMVTDNPFTNIHLGIRNIFGERIY